MPIDPTIALGAKAPPTINPLELAGGLAELQNKMNTAKQFKAEFAAKQRFGEIMAHAPDMDTAVAQAYADPDVASFAQDNIRSAASTRNTIVNSAGQIQDQGKDAYGAFLKNTLGLLNRPNDESAWQSLRDTTLTMASPMVKERLGKSIDYFRQGLNHGLSDDPVVRKNQIANKLTGFTLAAGVTPDAVEGVLGKSGLTGVGDELQPTMTAPPQGGPNGEAPGSVTKVGNALQLGLPPGSYSAEGIIAGGKYGSKGAAGGKLGPAVAPSEAESEIGADGKPLFAKGYQIPSTNNKTLGDVPVGPAGTIAAGAADKFAKSNAAKDSQNTMGLLAQQDADLDKLMQTGGFTTPGSGGEQRLAIAKTLNTISGILGGKPLVDTTAIGAGENAIKNIHTLSGNLLNQMYGVQREAALTIANIAKAVPGIDNTYLGGKMITDMLRAGARRSGEQYNFDNAWQLKRHGDLTGAEAEFARQHPMDDYVKPVLDKYGMNKDGFKSAEAVKKAVSDGWLTKDQAYAILNSSNFKE